MNFSTTPAEFGSRHQTIPIFDTVSCSPATMPHLDFREIYCFLFSEVLTVHYGNLILHQRALCYLTGCHDGGTSH